MDIAEQLASVIQERLNRYRTTSRSAKRIYVYTCDVIVSTNKAILVERDNGQRWWLPRKITRIKEVGPGRVEVEIPEWLKKRKEGITGR